MTWAKLSDDTFTKLLADVGNDAKLLHLSGLAHCAGKLTDGFVSAQAVGQLCRMLELDHDRATDDLYREGIWLPADGGWTIESYLDDNPSAERVAREREGNAKRQADLRKRRQLERGAQQAQSAAQRNAQRGSNAVTNTVTNTTSNGVSSTVSHGRPVPVPVPVPTPDRSQSIGTRSRTTPAHAGADISARADADAEVWNHPMSKEWYKRTFGVFRDGYGKTPPKELLLKWPELCPDEVTWALIEEALPIWQVSRKWLENNPGGDLCQKPEEWLRQKKYLERPAPYNNGTVNREEPQRRAGGDAPARAKQYAYGDNANPYWHENHGLVADRRRGRPGDPARGTVP